MTVDTIVFDLDGTLIDSAPSILAGFGAALAAAGLQAAEPLTAALIGPPLTATLARLSGIEDRDRLAPMAATFKRYYDSEGYRLSTVYDGADAALRALHADGVKLHLATNKRHAPTVQILDWLGWSDLFSSVYALDLPGRAAFSDKSAMLAAQLAEQDIDAARALYVGDRDEDRVAAEHNGLAFVGVDWGYGSFAPDQAHPVLGHMRQLPALLTRSA